MLKRWQPKIRLRFLFLLTFMLAAVLPAAFLAIWVIDRTTTAELESTARKQIALANRFVLSLDRYVEGRILIFEQCANAYMSGTTSSSGLVLAEKLDFLYFSVLYPDGTVKTDRLGDDQNRLTPEIEETLRQRAHLKTSLLPVMLDTQQTPTIFVVRRHTNGTIVAGAMTTTAISEMQETVSFGMHGHAVIVDQTGRALGHPKKVWEASLKSLVDIEPVRQSITGAPGSMLFFAPARQEDALAGYTRTEHGGWGVLMVRPIKEINDLA